MSCQRILFRSLLTVVLCAATHAALGAGPANQRATDAAFAALLSMPSAKPAEGSWAFPPADDYTVTNEAGLIAYLARQQRAGADVNAYRHQGTLLHHAIRAGLDQTATWLLAHGADPALAEHDASQNALELAQSRKRPALAALLRTRYAAALPPPAKTVAPAPTPTPTLEQIAPTAYAMQRVMQSAPDPAALQALPQSLLDTSQPDVLAAFAEAARASVSGGQLAYAVPDASWRVVWRRLGRPLDYARLTGLAGDMPPALWPELYASGYPHTNAQAALGCMLSKVSARQLADLWPQLLARFPELRQQAPRMLLAQFRLRTEPACDADDADNLAAKLQFLASAGVRERVPGLNQSAIGEAPAPLQRALAPFVADPASVTPRLVEVARSCTFALTDPWYAAINGKQGWKIDTVQAIDMPGSTQCALLVGGNEYGYNGGELIDGFDGPTVEPRASCPDPADVYEVWYEDGGVIRTKETDFGHDYSSSGLVPVRDSVSGAHYYLNDGQQDGQCHLSTARVPQLLAWEAKGLMRTRVPALEQALLDQCQAGESIACAGIAHLSPGAQPVAELTGARDAARERAWIDAVLALDKPALKRMLAAGAPPAWTGNAIKAVSAADLPLAEKRKRTAWLFVERGRLTGTLGMGWAETLVGWLPYQDWRPVVQAAAAIDGHGHYLEGLTAAARENGQERLACDIDNARGFLCGETISAN